MSICQLSKSVALAWLLLFGFCGALRAADGKPLAEKDLVALVRLQIADGAVAGRIQEGGLAFPVDDASLRRLKEAGASDAVLDAVRAARVKTKGPTIDGWGELVDPAGDCKVRLDNAALTMTVPGAYHDLWPAKGKVNAPLVLQDIEGDFTVKVKVARVDKAEKGTVLPDLASSTAFHAGTLVVWQDNRNFVRLDRTDMNKAGRAITSCYLHVFQDDQRTVESSQLVADKPTRLQLQRRGNQLTAAYSQDDGQTWRSLAAHRVALPAKVKVGVAALNSTSRPCSATFEGLELTPGRE